nr:RelA/SpoT domain-containing protein [Pseudosulfitobacter pseudonitzschiae]
MNAFQASLRNRARQKDVTVAQRLKRRVTIYDKLKRRPNFSLTEMQDIAGCRLIFKNIAELTSFRESYLGARFKHKLLTDDDRFDYILKPKADGYRGLHDVYEYRAARESGEPWNKLRIELQYRTIYQHAWATAVEVAGLLTENEHKFGRAADTYVEFFAWQAN